MSIDSLNIRTELSLTFQALQPGLLGEVTHAALFWDRGGTRTLAKLRRVPDRHLLVMCVEGQSDYVDESGVSCVILPGDVVMIPRGLAHSYRPTPGFGWSEIFAWIRGPLPDFWWDKRFMGPGLSILHAEPLMESAKLVCSLFAKSKASITTNDERIATLQSWLARLRVEARPPRQHTTHLNPWIARARQVLDEGMLREPRLRDLASGFCVSYETFRKMFKQTVGSAPGQYRVAAAMRQACRLLRSGGSTNKEIAELLQFSDEFHFAKRFRQRIGVSPRQYRSITSKKIS